jgi:hypothetical protein
MSRHLIKSALPFTIVLLLTIFVTSNDYAQTRDSLLRVYNNQTIHTFGNVFVKGSKQLKFRDLKPEFNSGIAKDLYKKSKGNLALGNVFTVTSIAALVTATVIKKNNKGAAIAFSAVAIGLNLGSLHFRKLSHQLVGRAIWHRNKEILFGVQ